MTKTKQMTETLIEIAKDTSRSNLVRYVAEDILDEEEPISYLKDVLHSGCESGIVTTLIYYVDTHAFFDRFYNDIDNLRYEFEQRLGEPLEIKGDLKNYFAWLAYEATARDIANELELDV